MEIKVIGSGCERCNKLYENLMLALDELPIEAKVIKVERLADILSLGIMTIPAVMINGKLKSSGQVLSKDKLKKILKSV
ncbi:MAG: thioredoxin family protein [Clostridium sp.]